MRQPFRLPHAIFGMAMGLIFAAACSVDSSGLPGGAQDAGPRGSGGRSGGAGGGSIGSGGTIGGGGGGLGSGGATGTGGGGDDGSGGSGSGGALGSGGSVGSGGGAGTTGGAGGGAGMPGGSGGRIGTGGLPGSGGAGAGGRAGTGGQGGTGGRAACGPATCPDGCCDDGVCVQGRSADACGRGGAVCRACKSCFRCAQGVCGLNAQSTWALTCRSAVIADETPDGDDWDNRAGNGSGLGGGEPDPYCQMTTSLQFPQSRTDTVVDDYTPTWNEVIATASANQLMVSPADIGVMDEDSLTSQRICSVPLDLTEADFERGSVTLSSEGCSSLTIGLTCAAGAQ